MNSVKTKKTKLIQSFCTGAALLTVLTTHASAIALNDAGTANNWYTAGGYQSGSGGEFYFQTVSGPVNNTAYSSLTRNIAGVANSFQTFCLEQNEWLGGSGVSYVVNDQAMLGGLANNHGPSGSQGGDRISLGTAWLYSQFALGELANYFTAPNRTTVAGLLQNAIWALEDEINDPAPGSNFYFEAAAAQFGSAEAAQANASTGQFGVWVLNNTVGSTKKQDMLFYGGGADDRNVPDGGSTVLLFGLSLGGLSLLARAKRQAKAI